ISPSLSSSSLKFQFLCSICLEVFSEPVSTPCGHNFSVCKCPLCNKSFSIRPELCVNTLLSEMISQLKLEKLEKRSSSMEDMQRRLKVQEITAALELSEREAQRETQQMVKVFSDIMESVQRCLDHHTKVMEQSLSKHKERAQALIQQLQQEMCELEKSSTEAQQLSLSTDPLHFLQRCPALPPAGLKDWSSVSFEPQTCEGSAARALSELETSLSQKFNKVFTQVPPKDRMRRVQTFAVDVTLDPDTAHPNLDLSEDLKQVHCGDVRKKLPDSPQRFDYCVIVLGKQSFSSGRFYFEVQVKGKTDWDLGVAQESVNRKGQITLSPKNGFWTIWLRDKDKYEALAGPSVLLSPLRPPQKVGVFVDYGAGLVSFYDVDSADLLYSFTGCCFREKLFPFFSPCANDGGTNSAPLIISAVDTESSTVCEGLK
uniref:B30.2/SPRY domain-containing protein n=1 Tax=Neogobius melanostomus TaxID=47308 RepID=A0A8C6SDQ6_9GOBI